MTKTIFVDWRIVCFFAPPFPQGGSKECVLLMKTILRSSMPILCKWYEGSFVVKTLGNVYMGRSCSLSAPLNAGGFVFYAIPGLCWRPFFTTFPAPQNDLMPSCKSGCNPPLTKSIQINCPVISEVLRVPFVLQT